jgi:hypothetical protein
MVVHASADVVLPVPVPVRPREHAVHPMAPVEAENLPATHAVQSTEVNEPAAAKKVPAAQAVHSVAPVSAW